MSRLVVCGEVLAGPETPGGGGRDPRRTQRTLHVTLRGRHQTESASKCAAVWKRGALRPQKPLRLMRDGEVGGSGILYLTPTRYTVTTRMMRQFKPLQCFINDGEDGFGVGWGGGWGWGSRSQDIVHKPQLLTGKKSRSRIEPRSFR